MTNFLPRLTTGKQQVRGSASDLAAQAAESFVNAVPEFNSDGTSNMTRIRQTIVKAGGQDAIATFAIMLGTLIAGAMVRAVGYIVPVIAALVLPNVRPNADVRLLVENAANGVGVIGPFDQRMTRAAWAAFAAAAQVGGGGGP